MESKNVIVYLPLKPEKAKIQNLPVKLPVRIEDFPSIVDKDRIDPDIIIRGLEAQYKVTKKDGYYSSYLVFHYYEAFKRALNKGQYEKAESWLNKAKEVKLDYRYYFYRGILLKKQNQLDAAELNLRKSTGMNQAFAIGYHELGNVLYSKKEYEDAAEFYLKAIELSEGEFHLPYIGIVDSYMASGLIEPAMEILEKIPYSSPVITDALLRKGVIFNEKQQYEKAEKIFSQAIKKEKRWELFYNRAFSKMRLGKLKKSQIDLENAWELNKEGYFILYELALINKKRGFVEHATDLLQTYLQNGNDPKGYFALSECFRLNGNFEEAKKTLEYLPDDQKKDLIKRLKVHENIQKEKKIAEPVDTIEPVLTSIELIYFNRILNKAITKALECFSNNKEQAIKDEGIDYGLLLKSLSQYTESERIIRLIQGIEPDEKPFKTEHIELFLKYLLLNKQRISSSELLSYRFPFLVSGNGKATAICRTIFKLFLRALSGEPFENELIIDDLEELKDLSFNLYKYVVDNLIKKTYDVEELMDQYYEKPENLVLVLIRTIQNNTLKDFKDRHVLFCTFYNIQTITKGG
ncbi:MAG: tetratricopeptide repeat protein [Thermotogota bacterium]|nr:tetratricopeptide repeat protein [Thermotogota bacterium]